MLNDNEYMIRTDFLPRGGHIYVDTSMRWVCPNEEIEEDEKMALQRLRGFRDVFRKRGKVSTTPLILKEIEDGFYHHRKKKDYRRKAVKRTNKTKKSFKGDRLKEVQMVNEGWRESYNESKKFCEVYKDIYKMLRKGMEMYSPKDVVSPKDIRQFVYDGNELSMADRELVYTALVAGNGHGILSADKPLLDKYKRGAKEFYLPDAFICDAIRGETCFAMGW